MEFVKIDELKDGMVISREIVKNNCMLLAKNVKLTKRYIEQLSIRDIEGVYIINESAVITKQTDGNLQARMLETLNDVKLNVNIDNNNITQAINKVVNALSKSVIELGNEDELNHSVSVAKLSMVVGAAMKLTADELYLLGMAALFHDLPEANMCNKIKKAKKVRELTVGEKIKAKVLIKQGCKNLMTAGISSDVKDIIEEHSLKMYCKEYSDNKLKENSRLAEIITMCDSYENLVNQDKISPNNAVRQLLDEKELFDRQTVGTFVRSTKIYPTNALVKLNTGDLGTVINGFADSSTRPTVRLLGTKETIRLNSDMNSSIEIREVYNV